MKRGVWIILIAPKKPETRMNRQVTLMSPSSLLLPPGEGADSWGSHCQVGRVTVV